MSVIVCGLNCGQRYHQLQLSNLLDLKPHLSTRLSVVIKMPFQKMVPAQNFGASFQPQTQYQNLRDDDLEDDEHRGFISQARSEKLESFSKSRPQRILRSPIFVAFIALQSLTFISLVVSVFVHNLKPSELRCARQLSPYCKQTPIGIFIRLSLANSSLIVKHHIWRPMIWSMSTLHWRITLCSRRRIVGFPRQNWKMLGLSYGVVSKYHSNTTIPGS